MYDPSRAVKKRGGLRPEWRGLPRLFHEEDQV
jgi:hypothetical protein